MNLPTVLLYANLALVLLAVELCWFCHQQKKSCKHDDVLFPFCQLRRDVVAFLHENVFEQPGGLSRAEYDSVRRLLDALNHAIRNYNEHKTLLFNLREVARYLRQYRHTLKQVKPVDVTKNRTIQQLHARFARCLAIAFLAYTPLIRYELLLKIVRVVAWRHPKQLRQSLLDGSKSMRALAHGDYIDGMPA